MFEISNPIQQFHFEFLYSFFSITVKRSNFLVAFPAPSPQVNGRGQTSIQQFLGGDVRELEYLKQVFGVYYFFFLSFFLSFTFFNIFLFIRFLICALLLSVCAPFFVVVDPITRPPQGRPIQV